MGPSPPTGAPRRRWWIVASLVLVAGLLLFAAWAVWPAPAGQVDVTSMPLTSSDHACGVRNQTLAGFVAHPAATVREVLTIVNPNGSAGCTVRSVAVSTAGFTLSGANTPLALGPSARSNLTFDLRVTAVPYAGPVDLDLE